MISHRPIGELRGCARLSDSAAGKRDMRSIFLTVQAFLATRTSWEHRRRLTEELAEKLLLHSLACRGHAGRPERRQVRDEEGHLLRPTRDRHHLGGAGQDRVPGNRAARRARESKTTLGYIGQSKAVGIDAGQPFPGLPLSLIVATDTGHNRKARALCLTTPP